MTLPDRVTISRIALSPVFFICFYFSKWTGLGENLSILLCWVLFAAMEVSDLLDGYLARKLNQNSDWGKVLDPFADSLSRLTYFACFAGTGILPLWMFIIILYRDLGVAYLRIIVGRAGTVLGARLSGKVKAWIYAAGGVGGMIRRSALMLGIQNVVMLKISTDIVFGLCAAVAAFSLVDYYRCSILQGKERHSSDSSGE